jgi:pimeloyl-ACP methyl ester carboxylesterase
MLPISLIYQWLQGLLSLGILGGAIFALWAWVQRARTYDTALDRYVFDPNWGLNGETALLALGLGLLLWSVGGRLLLLPLLGRAPKADGEDSTADPAPAATQRLVRPDGAELHVEFYGPEDGPPIVLTHAWSLDSAEWRYLKRQLGDRFRLIAWDLPGLGRSARAKTHDYSMEALAGHLEAVLDLAGGRPALLVGHSVGGMIMLAFCRRFPKALGTSVNGLALVHTTYTNPLRTTILPGLMTALERPVIVPLAYLTIWLSPLMWVMNWMNYLNGSSHLATRLTGFTGKGTWEQIELVTRPQPRPAPAVLARGTLGMLAFDATKTLPKIHVPTLVIAGDRDPLTRPQASEFIQSSVPGAQLNMLAPARHMGLIEHHTQVVQLLNEFALAHSEVRSGAR